MLKITSIFFIINSLASGLHFFHTNKFQNSGSVTLQFLAFIEGVFMLRP